VSLAQQELIAWVANALTSDVTVQPEVLPIDEKKISISVVLMKYGIAAPSHSNRHAPMSLTCTFLIFAHGEDLLESQRTLEDLLFKALEEKMLLNGKPFDVDFEMPDPAVWVTFGLTSRPCFWISLVTQRQRDVIAAPPVLKPLKVNVLPASRFSGTVRTRQDIPLQGASVILPSCNIATTTNSKGQFSFKAIVLKEHTIDIVVSYKQYAMNTKLKISHSPLDIVFRHKDL